MKKMISITLLIVMILSILTCSLSCVSSYNSKAGSMAELIGTYELTAYHKKNEVGEIYDYQAQESIKAYLIIKDDGFGYYFYSDKDTQLKAETVVVNYIHDEEDSTLIKGVEVMNGNDVSQWNKCVGCGDEPKMGFDKNMKTLNWTISAGTANFGTKEVEYSSALYTQISSDTTFGTVNTKLQSNYTVLPRYELSHLTDPLILKCNQQGLNYNKYEYFILVIDSYNETADVYYKTVGGVAQEFLNYDGFKATYSELNGIKNVTITLDYNKTGTDVLIGHDFYMYCNYKNCPLRSLYFTDFDSDGGTGYMSEYLDYYSGFKTTIAEIITELQNN